MKKETKKILKSLALGYFLVVAFIYFIKKNNFGINLYSWNSFEGIFITLAFGFVAGALIKKGFYD